MNDFGIIYSGTINLLNESLRWKWILKQNEMSNINYCSIVCYCDSRKLKDAGPFCKLLWKKSTRKYNLEVRRNVKLTIQPSSSKSNFFVSLHYKMWKWLGVPRRPKNSQFREMYGQELEPRSNVTRWYVARQIVLPLQREWFVLKRDLNILKIGQSQEQILLTSLE